MTRLERYPAIWDLIKRIPSLNSYELLNIIEAVHYVLDDDLREYQMWVGKMDQDYTTLPKEYSRADIIGRNIRDLFKFTFAVSAIKSQR